MKLYYPDYHDQCMEESAAGLYYLASEADAEIADMRAGFQLELASKDKWIDDLEQRMKRINAINDNPAVYNSEIDQLSSL